jgi:mycoredoxin
VASQNSLRSGSLRWLPDRCTDFGWLFLAGPFLAVFAIMLRMQMLVYSASWCRDCREAKRFLDQHKIAYTEIDIEVTPGAAAELIRQVGKRAIPQFVINGEWVQPYRPGRGFLYKEMTERLGLENCP